MAKATGAKKDNKRWLFICVPAAFVVVGLIAFGATKCNRVNEEKVQNEETVRTIEEATKKMNEAAAKVDSLFVVNRELTVDNAAKSDTIKQQKQIISKQHDSIVGLKKTVSKKNNELKAVKAELEDCKKNNSKTVVKKPKKTTETKPVVQAVRTTQVVVVPVSDTVASQVRNDSVAGTGSVRLSKSENSGVIIVNGRDAAVVLENESVNTGTIVVGNNNLVQVYENGAAQLNANNQVVDTVANRKKPSVVCTYTCKQVLVNTR